MKNTVLSFASIYGASAVILGAFGAHALKKILSVERLASFETGVKYQMYHALLLLLMAFLFKFEQKIEVYSAYSIIWGVILFSGSIYGLSLKDYWPINLRFLGPITPLGGLLLVAGWSLMAWHFIRN
jgi:uncharacterized membrane protein YgdD (TMEM256/DUF423 family)